MIHRMSGLMDFRKKPYRLRTALAGAMAVFSLSVPVSAQAPSLALLDGLHMGRWTLRDLESGATREICLRSGRELIQLQHAQPGCSRTVVQDAEREVTVQYTCHGNGYGRTSIRREHSDLVQVTTQGIEGGAPFSTEYEARRIGDC